MIIGKESKFALVGHGYALYHLYHEFLKHNLKEPIIITHKKKFHLRDIKESNNNKNLYRDIFELEEKTKVHYVSDINSQQVLDILKVNKVTHIFSISSRFIFKDRILNKFKNKIFNIHGTLLPEERGSGTYTYRIMNKKYFCAATIHIIEKNLDKGNIILQSKKKKISKKSLPIDFIINTNKVYIDLIKKFSKIISNKKKINIKIQKEVNASYLPRFYTDRMGAINFQMDGRFIESFIKSCSKPYSGAFCYINYNKPLKIKIFNAKFIKGHSQHPFLFGKIYHQNKKQIKVIVKNGFLLIELKNIKFYNMKSKLLFLGKTLYNNFLDLHYSKTLRTSVFDY